MGRKITTAEVWVCVQRCYFNLRRWNAGDETPYIAGIENCPYFEKAGE